MTDEPVRSAPVLGIDIGGSGIKGAPVDLATGELTTKRMRIPTPAKSTPPNVADVVREIVANFADAIGDGPIGVTIPAVVTHGMTRSAANIDKSWIDCEAEKIFQDHLGRDVLLVNDADAAGIAEVHYGAAKDHPGLVLLTTLGTGIGTAIVYRGVLVPNSELGHIEVDGHDAESRAASSIKDKEGLSFSEWAKRLQRYYEKIEAILWPDLIVIGGGVSKESAKFIPKLKLKADLVPAKLLNTAGIVGAAWLAADRHGQPGADAVASRPQKRSLPLHPFESLDAEHVQPGGQDPLRRQAHGQPGIAYGALGLQHRALLVEHGERTGQVIEVRAEPVRLQRGRHVVDDFTEAGEQQRERLLGRFVQHQHLRLFAEALGLRLAQHLGHPGVRVLEIRAGVAGGLHHPGDVEHVVLVQPVREVGVLDRRQRDRRRGLLPRPCRAVSSR